MTILGTEFDSVLAVVAERAPAGEEARQLDDEVAAALAGAGLNRMLLPAEIGGDEVHPREVMDVVGRVAAAHGSAGWCTAISAGTGAFAGYIKEAAARAMYDDLDTGAAGVFAPSGVVRRHADGTATLTGRWGFVSNCTHSRWIGLGAFVEDADGNREEIPRLVFVAGDDVTIEDTWHGAGLRATSSHHVRVDDVPVDLDRSCRFGDASWPKGTLWRMPLFSILGPVLVSAPLGVARGAIDEVQRAVLEGVTGVRGALADNPVGLAELAGADAALRAARAGLVDAVDVVWQRAAEGERASRQEQARVTMAVQHAADVAAQSTSVAHRLCGGAAAYVGHRVVLSLRDVEAARQHMLFSHQFRPALMRIASGIDEVLPPMVM